MPGAREFLTTLRERDLPFCVFTNGTVKTPAQCADALQQAGLPVHSDGVLTPASSAVEVFRRRGHRRVMVLGVKGITEVLEQAGIEALPPLRGTSCDAVFAGWYRQELTIEALEAAIEAVNGGAQYYSASQSPYFATSEGRTLGSSRAISAVVRDVTRTRVTVVGNAQTIESNQIAAHVDRMNAAVMQTAPIASERFQDALPLIPGVVRGPDGLLNIGGARSNQSALRFNNADGTDPVTGDDAVELPIDAVSSVEVRGAAFAPEFGLSAGAVTTVHV